MDNTPAQLSQKQELEKSFNSMKQYAFRWVPAWKTLSDYIDQTRGIFDGDRTRIGQMINHKLLLDSHATMAKRITASGMQTGMTDPARPWFKLTMDNFLLDNIPGVREWLDEVSRRMLALMNKSNIYKTFQNCYDELVEFGTGCFLILEDYDDVIRGRSFTCGEYFLRVDEKGRVNAFAREYEMTVANMVKEFGLESCSVQVQSHWNQNQKDIPIKVRHLIEANDTRIPDMEDFKNMPFRSVYWESGNGNNLLAHRGYKRFPVIAPRWDAITTDMIYGYGPGWHAIGDIKELQAVHKDMLIAQEKLHNPPKVEDANVVGHSNTLPGGVTKSSSIAPNTGVRAAYQIDPRLDAFINSIETLHNNIDKLMFADLFLMISSMPVNASTTAFEIATRKQEQMMMLGPILHSLNEEMHSRAIDIIFDLMSDNGLVPEPPEGIQGQEVRIQYISILAQAQMAMGVQDIERTLTFVGQATALYGPTATDNFDVDEAIKEVCQLNGVQAKLIVSDDAKAQIRQARTDQQNKMIALQAGVQASDAAAKLGNTPGQGSGSALDNAGQAVAGAMSGQ